jgi:hypothetical protein
VLLALAVLVTVARRNWSRPEWRFASVGFVASFVITEVMNLYIQPQDPQMQLQPMVWLPFAVGAVFLDRRSICRFMALVIHTRGDGGGLPSSLLVVNAAAYAGNAPRGLDRARQRRGRAGVRASRADDVRRARLRAADDMAHRDVGPRRVMAQPGASPTASTMSRGFTGSS